MDLAWLYSPQTISNESGCSLEDIAEWDWIQSDVYHFKFDTRDVVRVLALEEIDLRVCPSILYNHISKSFSRKGYQKLRPKRKAEEQATEVMSRKRRYLKG